METENISNEKIYFSIGEVSKMLKVNASLIRFWEKQFDIIKPHKNKKGNRYFTKQDVKNLKMIYHLVKEKGYNLKGAKTRMRASGSKLDSKIDTLNSLKNIRSFLSELKTHID
ncbi:MAG TPA: MerR family transcriptional regulator [Bacteroidia bacterium]|nr:MerR family transcriptional regulator [Bacteroidia bacterium]HNT79822.1 MerR family transcriptional regulator [Bacteroidia bacterium]